MPYSYILIKKSSKTLAVFLVCFLVVGVFSALLSLYSSSPVSAATNHCLVVADDQKSAVYYQQSASGCGEGNAVQLSVRPQTMDGIKTITFSNSTAIGSNCQNIETYAMGERKTLFCIQYNPGESSAFVSRGDKDGNFNTYDTDTKLAADIKKTETNQSQIDSARINATYAAFNGTLNGLMSKYYQTLTNPPCSSQGCADGPWKKVVYDCWQTGRSNAATTARWSAQGGVTVDTAQLTKDEFAKCLEAKMKGSGVTAAGIVSTIQGLDTATINGAAQKAEDEVKAQQDAESGEAGDETDDEASSCGIEGIGWIVCPVLGFLGTVTDTAFSFLATNFLETSANTLRDDGIRNAWGAIRNIANVLFVIAFIVIVYSQLTSSGLGNYGVKKILPRLIIAAVLVNLSLIICQLAVDLSNLLGYSLKTLFDGGLLNINGDVSGDGDATGNGFGIAALMVGLLAGGITLALSISMPVILAALLALVIIVLILFARTALIIVLTIISPLAFVAYLLPNTEQWFKKWYKMFFALLMVFPIIGVVFGASSLAAGIINDVAVTDDNVMMQVVAVGVATIPLFLVPSLLKNSLNAAGSIGAKLSGMASKQQGAAAAKSKAKRGERYGNSRLAQFQGHRAGQRDKRRRLIQSGAYNNKNRLDPRNLMSAANRKLNQSKLSGNFGDQSAAAGVSLNDAEFQKDVNAAQILQQGMTSSELLDMAKSGNTTVRDSSGNAVIDTKTGLAKQRKVTDAERTSAMQSVMTSGSFGQRRDLLSTVASDTSLDRRAKSRVVQAAYSKGDQNVFGTDFGDKILDGTIKSEAGLTQQAVNNASNGNLKAEDLVHSAGATKWLADEITKDSHTTGNTKAVHGFVDAARSARTSEHTAAKIDGTIDGTFKSMGA